MRHYCDYCSKAFSTKFNLERHIERVHPHTSMAGRGSTEENSYSDDSFVSKENDASDDLSNDSISSYSEEEDEDGDSQEKSDAFEKLVTQAWQQVLNEHVSEHSQLSRHEAVKKARKTFRKLYKNSLLWYRSLKKDPTHKAVMETAEKLRNEDDFDYEESIESAISSRKFLLNRQISSDAEILDSDKEEVEENTHQ